MTEARRCAPSHPARAAVERERSGERAHLYARSFRELGVGMSGRTWVERAAITALCLAAIGSGCAWGPGMRMDEGALRERTEGTDAGFVLIPLTPDAVREQTEAAQHRP